VKTNHRDSTRKRRDRHRYSPSGSLKEEASANRRRLEAQVCDDVKAGRVEPEDAVAPTLDREVSNPWNWD
jgi:hypothetical protein